MRAILLIAFSFACYGQGQLQLMMSQSAAAASSNIALVQTAPDCKNTTSGDITCTFGTAVGAGHLITIEQFNYATTAGTSTTPTMTGETFAQAASLVTAGQGSVEFWYATNTAGGQTVVTVKPAAGASHPASAVVSEWSGIATSSALLGCSAAATAIGSSTQWFTQPGNGTAANDLAIGAVYDRASTSRTNTPDTGWTALQKSTNTSDGDEGFTQYLLNGIASQYTSRGVLSASGNYWAGTCAYKSAVAGSAPSGNQPTMYTGFENSTNGTTLTTAILLAGLNGGLDGVFSFTGASNFTVSTSAQQNNLNASSVNGSTYAAATGTRGISMTGTATTAIITFADTPATLTTSIMFKVPTADTVLHSFLTVTGNGSADYAAAQTGNNNSHIHLECLSGDSSDIDITTKIGSWLFAMVKYVKGGTHALRLYDTSGTQFGAEVTCAATGTTNPVSVGFGQSHNQTVTQTLLFDNWLIDMTGTWPLK